MPPSLDSWARERLAVIREQERFRVRQPHSPCGGAEVAVADGRRLRVFCSNDYLGLARDPALIDSLQQAAATYGVGSGASQYVSGHADQIAALEAELADYLGYPRVLVFGAGYLANTGVIDALVGRGDHIVSDALNHASLIDGCRLSGAQVHRYSHADAAAADTRLGEIAGGRRLLISDAVFSMDGDCADLTTLAGIAARRDAALMVDDAHGIGVLGPEGRGSVAAAGLGVDQVPVLTGTLGKALGGFGAFVAGSDDVIEYLTQVCRTVIFTTGLPPAVVAAVRTGLQLARRDDWRRERLQALVARWRDGLAAAGLPVSESTTPIQPLLVGAEADAMALSARLREAGFWVTAIRPPTVPAGTSRLRVTFSAAHSLADVDDLIAATAAAWHDLRLRHRH